MEIWKDIKGYEGLYQVSDLGNARNVRTSKILKKSKSIGYWKCVLCTNGVPKSFLVHRLIANAFIPNPESKPCINHIDGKRDNNSIANLEWCSQKENVQHAVRTGLLIAKYGETRHTSKLTNQEVFEIIAKRKAGIMLADLAKEYNVTPPAIHYIVKGLRWNKTTKIN